MIAFLIGELNVCGGTHKQFLKLLEYTRKKGIDYVVVTKVVDYTKTYPGFKSFSNKIFVLPKIHMIHRVLNKLGVIDNLQRQKKILRKIIEPADVINIHDNGFENFLDAFKGKKVFWQVNDLPPYCRVGVHKKYKLLRYEKDKFENLMANLSIVTDFTVNVQKNADRILEVFHRTSHVFYCGISPILIKRDVSKSIERFRSKKINLLSSGVFFPYRNYETQIEVVKLLVKKGWDVHLNIFGKRADLSYADKIDLMIKDNGLNDNIKIWGQISDDQYVKLHMQSDMFVFINIDQSWGLAVFEAQSCGLPVIVSNSVGAVEILNDGIDSIFVEPTSVEEVSGKIEELAKNEERYQAICKAAKEFHKNWTWDDAYCSKMIDLMIPMPK